MKFFLQPALFYLKKLYTWVLPYTCILCRYPTDIDQDICLPCIDELPILPHSCPRCANTLTPPAHSCEKCLANPPFFDTTHALFSYETPITKLLLDLKFQHCLINAKVLGELMAISVKEDWYENKQLPEMIIPVPLHAKRLKERGFNQALELAKPVSKRLKIPINYGACVRIKHTQAQAMLSANDRSKNITDAFVVQKNIAGCYIVILDDVITTGQTINELSGTLKKAGAGRIDVWCCAKTFLT